MKPSWHDMSPETTRELQQRFLDAYVMYGTVGRATTALHLPRGLHNTWLRTDFEYAEAYYNARELIVDQLESEAIRRAKDGVERPVYQGGELVGTVTEYSDSLLMFLLKGMRPDKYRERIAVLTDNTIDEEIKRIEAELAKRGLAIEAESQELPLQSELTANTDQDPETGSSTV